MANKTDSQLENQSSPFPLGKDGSNPAKSKPGRAKLHATRGVLRDAIYRHDGAFKSQCSCGRDWVGRKQDKDSGEDGGQNVAIVLNPSTNTAGAAGLAHCHSVWACPDCRAKILSARAQALRKFADGWSNTGGGSFTLALTVPHNRAMSLADEKGTAAGKAEASAARKLAKSARKLADAATVEDKSAADAAADAAESALADVADRIGLTGALSRLFTDGSYRRWLKSLGYAGAVKSLEATHGRNGWHLHSHILVFTDNSRDITAQDEDKISEIWARVCVKAGLGRPSREHGARLTQGGAADYVIKWGAPNELMSQAAKGAKNGNVTIAQMENMVLEGNTRYVSLLREYYLTMKGAKLVTYLGSNDFRAQIRGVVDKESDEEISAEKEMLEEAVVIALIKPRLWRRLYDMRLTSQVLDAAELGGYAAVRGLIKRRVPHRLDEVRMPDR